jgi:formylglycine-generating enzyme
MHRRSRFVPGGWVWSLAALAMGCGTPPPPPQPVVQPAAQAQRPEVANAQPAQRNAAARPAAADPASHLAFPKADPNDVLQAVSDGPQVEVEGPAPQFEETDRFTVELGQPGGNSQLLAVQVATAPAGAPRPDVRLPDGFVPLPEHGFTDDGRPRRIRCEKDQSQMAFVPAGIARVGSHDGPPEAAPEFVVFLDPFYMDVTEVTIRQFHLFRDDQKEQKKRTPLPPINETAGGNHPALGIAWGEAKNYTRWAGKDLPTEAEFEKAGRGQDGFRFPWGNDRPVWHRPRTPETIATVGAFRGDVSPFGIYDLAGNAREWVEDYFVSGHQEAVQSASLRTLTNWAGPRKASVGTQRVLKGNGPDWALWHRSGTEMSQRLPNVGFRGVLRIKPDSSPDAATRKSAT